MCWNAPLAVLKGKFQLACVQRLPAANMLADRSTLGPGDPMRSGWFPVLAWLRQLLTAEAAFQGPATSCHSRCGSQASWSACMPFPRHHGLQCR
ncbi:hypothetical protein V5799_033384, partial [Amblyomma americanum]